MKNRIDKIDSILFVRMAKFSINTVYLYKSHILVPSYQDSEAIAQEDNVKFIFPS